MSISKLKRIEDPEELYNECKRIYLNHISKFDDWVSYRNWLQRSNERKFNKSYIPEQLLEIFRYKIRNLFFEKYFFFKMFNPNYSQYNEFLETCKNHAKFFLTTKSGSKKVSVELFNIKKEDLYYPNYMRVISIHSGLHSLVLFLVCKDDKRYINKQFGLYMEPLFTHPGDREYTLYYSAFLYGYPLIILKLKQNLSWTLEINGVHTLFRTWCRNRFKTIPSKIFFKQFFYPWQYKFTVKQLHKYCNKYNIEYKSSDSKDNLIKKIESRLKLKTFFGSIPPPNKTQYIIDKNLYGLYKWNNVNKEWIGIDHADNKIPEYKKKRDKTGRFITWEKTGEDIRINNILQLIGIAKYQSDQRRVMNPNIKLDKVKSLPNSNFFLYQYYPIYDINHNPVETMNNIIQKYSKKLKSESTTGMGIAKNPYELEYGISYKKETRFGCFLCPYKTQSYYKTLLSVSPLYYWYCRFLELLGSVKNLVGEIEGLSDKGIEDKIYRYYPEEGLI
ncbi:MAG: hypothetical protein GF317_05770 [Candidatus Lokiarchaeota archaeon]|nr:hypothetical protein [Candidatus Lokiarchaeota archaeon]